MKKYTTITSFGAVTGGLLLGLGLAVLAYAGDQPLPGNCSAFGKPNVQWQELYWQWAFGQVTLPVDGNGNAVACGNVVLMPLPNAPGDGTPASVDVTLSSGQAFVLPLWNIFGTTYYPDGTLVDPAVPLSVFRTLDVTFKIDGQTVVDRCNVMEYYVHFAFVPPIAYDSPPYLDIVWLQGIGLVHTPLTPGHHTFKLDVKNVQPVIDALGNA